MGRGSIILHQRAERISSGVGMKRRKEELEFGEVAETFPDAKIGGESSHGQARKLQNQSAEKRAKQKHRKGAQVTKEDDVRAIQSSGSTSPSDWFFAQFLKCCGKTLSHIEQERSIPGKLKKGC